MKLISKQPFLAGGILGIALSSLGIAFLLDLNGSGRLPYVAGASVEFIQNTEASTRSHPGLPARLKIPRIGVDAALQYVGLTQTGAMDVPKGPTDAAWFESGPRPGESGSAVIAGHYGHWKNGGGSVFDKLHTLEAGDTIFIEDEKGAITTFVVRESLLYDPKADTSDIFGSNDGKSHLNLITCEGIWDDVSRSYSERLVVFADKE